MSERADDPIRRLPSWARHHGVSVSPDQLESLCAFLDELAVWNRRINLTGISSRERIVRELVLDSLIPLSFLPDEGELLDVGSGAGFPAIPLKICKPHLDFHFLEANSRKVSFLKQVVRLIGLRHVKITQGRIGRDDHLLRPKGYHVITARGLAKIPQVLRWCGPHMKKGGLLFNFQGNRYQEPLEASSSMCEEAALALRHTLPYTLPGMASPRHVLVFERGRPAP